MKPDRIDEILAQWQQQLPQVNTSALSVVGRVLRLARILEKHRETFLAQYNLNVWSFDVLATLRRQGPPYQLKPTELYGLLMLSSGAMTNRIDRMEKDGIVVRIRDSDDRRSVLVQLTPKGLELAERVVPALLEGERELLAQFTAKEEQTLITALRQLLTSLEKDSP